MPSNPDIIEMIKDALQEAEKMYERRLFIIYGKNKDVEEAIYNILGYIKDGAILCVSNSKKLRNKFKESCESSRLTVVSCWDTDEILGKTFDVAYIDMRDWPDVIALSRAIGTVRGGGLIFVMLPYRYDTKIYHEEIVPPYFDKPPRGIMLERIYKKSEGYRGVYLYDASKNEIIVSKKRAKKRSYKKATINIPTSPEIPRKIYELAASNDQIEVLRAFENWENYIILLANRGRGKSASIGLGLVGYASLFIKRHKRPLFICLTSRSTLNVEEVYRFAQIALESLGVKYDYNPRESILKSDILRLQFEFPHRALRMANIADALVVDEVAAIPFTFLRKTVRLYDKIVFSGTVHGYEGTGRIFAVRFLKMLDDMKKTYKKIELKQPIRYSENDPIEEWLFDLLLLDAEPYPAEEEILDRIDEAKLVELSPRKYFLGGSKHEKFLRSIIGILTTAHYRNNPKDLLLLSDAPHHRLFALVIDSIPLVALQIAEEGNIPEEYVQEMLEEAPSGHLIPDNITRYTGMVEFPTMKGFRIVRIATHPNLQGRGLGSLALEKLVIKARDENVEWIGASFGASPRLLNFWLKNKFYPANMSPIINPKTGEYSIIVIRPLTKRARDMISEANKQLKIRLLRELRNSYWELETETAHMVLKSGEPVRMIPQLTTGDVFRLGLYMSLGGKIEACIDVVAEIVNTYFARMYKFLSREEEFLLVRKICQRRLIEKEELIRIRRIIRKLWENMVRFKFKGPEKRKR